MESIDISILIVDDDASVGRVLSAILDQAGFKAEHEVSAEAAMKRLSRSAIDLVITDLRMPSMDGMQLLREVVQNWPDIPVIMLTAYGTVSDAVEAMKIGARDFMLKPFDRDEVIYTVHRTLKSTEWLRRKPPDSMRLPSGFIGDSKPMRELAGFLHRAAQSTATILLRGESGTGKELAAKCIHEQSNRQKGPLVVVHCAALPENLLESELFGYQKGAFTGAVAHKPGRVELADGGTLFLDEIAELPLSMQVKLLRLIQDREVQRLGATKSQKADVRFISATHRDLEKMVEEGTFREDLFYRVNVLPIWLPPLRERPEDIPLLAEYFCEKMAIQNQRPGITFEMEALQVLSQQEWPGNVRQLQNFIERLVVFVDSSRISADAIQQEFARCPDTSIEAFDQLAAMKVDGSQKDLKAKRLQAERSAVVDALERAHDNRTVAARLLGISRRTLYKKIELFKL